ncbi:hypothetical protein HUJ05_000267 [Dendroctonus ponderosae]|nr:hypothetical protein HUJ05_000267 [Dendroctonus ponderosae]
MSHGGGVEASNRCLWCRHKENYRMCCSCVIAASIRNVIGHELARSGQCLSIEKLLGRKSSFVNRVCGLNEISKQVVIHER